MSHIQHPYDDHHLLFYDLRKMIVQLLEESPHCTEKLDGQAVSAKWSDGEVKFARNKTDLKQGGVSYEDFVTRFEGHAVGSTFIDAAARLNKLRNMGNTEWCDFEILDKRSRNVCAYPADKIITLHGQLPLLPLAPTIQWGTPVDSTPFLKQLDELGAYSSVGEYLRAGWVRYLARAQPNLPSPLLMVLVSRWCDGDKSFDLRKISTSWPEWRAFVLEGDEKRLSVHKAIRKPLELLVCRVGGVAIKRIINPMAIDDDFYSRALRQIAQLPEHSETIRLQDIGIDLLSHVEGVVFGSYKWTGTFGPLNQIFGVVQVAKMDVPVVGEKPVVLYAGRFQPFHPCHYAVYLELVEQWGVDRVFIVTSDKHGDEKSPLSFIEKRAIMVQGFGIPASQIIEERNPYKPTLLSRFPASTPYITALSVKDSSRLVHGYYRPLSTDRLEGYEAAGYIQFVEEKRFEGKELTGTFIRQVFRSGENVKGFFDLVYGEGRSAIFGLMRDKIN